jgi:hypothetical protein
MWRFVNCMEEELFRGKQRKSARFGLRNVTQGKEV